MSEQTKRIRCTGEDLGELSGTEAEVTEEEFARLLDPSTGPKDSWQIVCDALRRAGHSPPLVWMYDTKLTPGPDETQTRAGEGRPKG